MPDCFERPFRVTVIRDRRSGYRKDGKYGTCLGRYIYPHTDRPEITEPHEIGEEPPEVRYLIKLDDGSYIWSRECWWTDAIINGKDLESLQKTADNIDASVRRDRAEYLR